MVTNYSSPKIVAAAALLSSTLDKSVADSIISKLGRTVAIDNITDPAHKLVSADLTGQDIVYSRDSTPINLNTASLNDVKNLDSLIFSTNSNINLTMNSGKGADAFTGWVVTNAGNDTIKLSGLGVKVSSGDGNDSIITGKGNDSILSGNGNDSIVSGIGNDTINSGSGNDSINSGAGNDSILTGNGNDSVDSGDGNDSIITGKGNDSIITGNGNDSLIIGAGNDTVSMGAGIDIVKLAAGYTGNSNLDGGTSGKDKDILDLTNVNIISATKSGANVTITLIDHSIITATNFESFIYDSNGVANGGITTVGVDAFVLHVWPTIV